MLYLFLLVFILLIDIIGRYITNGLTLLKVYYPYEATVYGIINGICISIPEREPVLDCSEFIKVFETNEASDIIHRLEII